MPLIQGKSKKAFEENIKAEVGAGKPKSQALAIAYNVKRHNARKNMAMGGMVTNEKLHPQHEPSDSSHAASIAHAILNSKKGMADGGMLDNQSSEWKDVEAMSESGDDFLSSPDAPEVSQPQDSNEMTDDSEKKKMRLASIMSSVRMRHMGK